MLRRGAGSQVSDVRDGVDFNQRIRRDPGGRDGAASRWLVAEFSGIDFVHTGEVFHVSQEDGATQHFFHGRTGGFQLPLHFAHREFRMGFDVARRFADDAGKKQQIAERNAGRKAGGVGGFGPVR